MSKEIWKEFEKGYLVSNRGRFYDNKKNELIEVKNYKGNSITIQLNSKFFNPARLVAENFIEPPLNWRYDKIYFYDGNERNIDSENLVWTMIKGFHPEVLQSIVLDIKRNKTREFMIKKYDITNYDISNIMNRCINKDRRRLYFNEIDEEWKDIDLKNYMISSYGRLYDKRNKKYLEGVYSNKRELAYGLQNRNLDTKKRTRVLAKNKVAEYFLNNKYNLDAVYNKTGDTLNIHYDNLEYTLYDKMSLNESMNIVKMILIDGKYKHHVVNEKPEFGIKVINKILKRYNENDKLNVYNYFNMEDPSSEEVWKRHPIYNEIMVSNEGRFYNAEINKYLKAFINKNNGNKTMTIKRRNFNCARIILETFKPKDNEFYETFYFKDGNRNNLNLDNLAWTFLVNKSPELCKQILKDRKNGISQAELTRKYKIGTKSALKFTKILKKYPNIIEEMDC
ncbi:HNH endonuclease [Staphylococcus phage vB_StaM_PB50]|nr:HNH endonuclease [Staphylococcus phage vB_StaM_PB50]